MPTLCLTLLRTATLVPGAERTGISAVGAAGTEGMAGLYQVDLGEVKLAGEERRRVAETTCS